MAVTYRNTDTDISIRITATDNLARNRIVIECPSRPEMQARVRAALKQIIGPSTQAKKRYLRRRVTSAKQRAILPVSLNAVRNDHDEAPPV